MVAFRSRGDDQPAQEQLNPYPLGQHGARPPFPPPPAYGTPQTLTTPPAVHLPTRQQLAQQASPTAHLQPDEAQQLMRDSARGDTPRNEQAGAQGQGAATNGGSVPHPQHPQQRSQPPPPPPPLASLDADALPADFRPKRLLCFAGILAAYAGAPRPQEMCHRPGWRASPRLEQLH